jgi:uncharacterized protein YggU (UPF0235/DUF167 family)
MTNAPLFASPDVIRFAVRLTPKGGRDAIEGWGADSTGKPVLRARVAVAPEDGKANRALIALLASAFDVGKTKIRIVSGKTARVKIVEVSADSVHLTACAERFGH